MLTYTQTKNDKRDKKEIGEIDMFTTTPPFQVPYSVPEARIETSASVPPQYKTSSESQIAANKGPDILLACLDFALAARSAMFPAFNEASDIGSPSDTADCRAK